MARAIELHDIGMVFASRQGSVHALDEVSFGAEAGEFLCIVGPSGCGKTTLLKILAGLLFASTGTVQVNGESVRGPISNVGMVFQSPVLMPWRTVLDNIMLQVEVRNLDRGKYRQVALGLLQLVGLAGFERKYPYQLSGGMQQRVSICRALIHDPALLLMDEPFGAIDALTREQMNLELQRIWLDHKKTVVFVTHSIPEAVFLADRVLVMSARPGRLLKVFDVELPRPRTLETMAEPRFSRMVTHIRREMQAHGGLE
ncbi:MAG: ABC transporter ATP-binding protein [Chloroflexi bacterium]|nr:ABC transporter ATP-binding protein [Chloroflexota bacterium]